MKTTTVSTVARGTRRRLCANCILLWLLIPCFASGQAAPPKKISKKKDPLSAKMLTDTDVMHFVKPLKQPRKMQCWATVLFMLYNWKNAGGDCGKCDEPAIRDVVSRYGQHFVDIFDRGDSDGIDEWSEQELYKKAKFNLIQATNLTPQYWYQLLKRRGPLSVTVGYDITPDKKAIHALLITGMKGDYLTIMYIDPGDGLMHTVRFDDFVKLYEGSSKWPLQVVHY